eukprot:TRINITY_DN29901_c0_g1_i1.p1 TRINITY_DN29901_c0_g1~~TRINITY_DN29901_c0_g1_i1.p1  ORF type:complete len:301 (-),score=24.83 TRINITY_DN29901_c0_g1_i1:1239-2141(-)
MFMERQRISISVVIGSSRVGHAAILSLLRTYKNSVTIRAVFRSEARASTLSSLPEVEFVTGVDGLDPSSHHLAFANIQRAFIVAPQLENRHEIVNKFLDSAKENGVEHVTLIGGVFQEEEKFLYHRQWMSSRRHAERLGLPWAQLECSDFMENVYRNQERIRKEGEMAVAGVEGLSAPVALADVGSAAAAILAASDISRHRNRVYRIIGPETLRPADIAAIFTKSLGRTVKLVDLGVDEARKAAIAAEVMPKWQAEGFYDWLELYYITGRLGNVQSDLVLLHVEPTTFHDWLQARRQDFL